MLNEEYFFKLIDTVLSYCNYYTMVSVVHEENGSTRFAKSQIQKNGLIKDTVVTITVYDKKRKAQVRTNILDSEGLKNAVIEAETNLKFVPEDDTEVIELREPNVIINNEYDDELYKKFGILNRSKLIKAGIDILPKNFTASGTLSLNKYIMAIGNSNGIKRYGRRDKVSLNMLVTHVSGSAGYVEYATNKALELDILKEFKNAYIKAKQGIESISLEPGNYTVILEPLAIGDLLTYMSYYGFSAKSIQNATGFFVGKLGNKVFKDNITIIDDINNTNTFAFPFDFEGYERIPLKIIEKGYVKELAYDVHSSVVDKVKTTGHSVGNINIGGYACNLVMDSGESTIDELIQSVEKGVLISRFHYIDIVDSRKAIFSALIRDGAFLIEDGEIKKGIKNMRFTDNMFNIFNNIVGISKERKKVQNFLGVNYVPTVKVENFHFTQKID